MFLRIITFVTIIIVLLCIITYISLRETFTDTPLFVVKVTRSPNDIFIEKFHKHDLSSLNEVDHIIQERTGCTDCILSVKTFHSIMNSNALHKLIAVLPTEQTCLFIKRRNMIQYESLKDIIVNEKTIAYIDDLHKSLLQNIITGYDINTAPQLIKVNINTNKNIDIDDNIYCLFMLHEFEYDKLQFNHDIDIIDCEGININIIKSLVPYIKLKNKDFAKYLTNFKDKYSIKTCFTFDNLLVGSDTFDEIKYTPIINDIHSKLKDESLMNFYSMFTNNSKSLESFINNVQIYPKENINGYYISPLYFKTSINSYGVPVSLNDNIYLQYQERSEENGAYYVKEISDNIVTLERISNMNIIDDTKGSAFICIGDQSKTTKEKCEENDDNIWDKPCERNEECPFYQKNKNYKNYRGGCIDGVCEMPIGVKRKGFRYYDTNIPPLCYNCPSYNQHCCSQQSKPDYIFSMDSFERMYEMGNTNWFNKTY